MERNRAPLRAASGRGSGRGIGRAITISINARTLWTVAGIALLLIALSLVVIKGLQVLLLLYISIVIAEGLRPLIDWLQERRVPRPLAVFAIYLAALALLVGVGWLIVQPLVNQVVSLAGDFPRYADQAQRIFAQLEEHIGQSALLQQAVNAAQGALGGAIQGIVRSLINLPIMVGQLLVDGVVILVITFFWLTGVERLRPFFVGLFPSRSQSLVQSVLDELGEKTGGYLRGVAIDAVVVGVLSGLAVWLIGAPYPLILGVLAGVTELIPYFGPWISGAFAALITALSGQVVTALLVIVAYIVIQQVEGHVLIPYVMMRVVEVNPLTVVVATLLGFALLGIVGGVLAVPTASIIHVLVVRMVAPMIRAHTHWDDEPDNRDMPNEPGNLDGLENQGDAAAEQENAGIQRDPVPPPTSGEGVSGSGPRHTE